MQDLNLKPRNSEKERNVLIKRVFECGWDRIAWNTVATGKITSSSQSKLIKSAQLSQIECCESKTWRSLVTSNQTTQVKQYNRLTMIIDELVDAQQLTAGNEYLRSFDIIAVCPGNAKIFSFLCKTAQIDIISINFAHKIPFTLNKKLLDEAVARGIFFEIVYSPLITTPQMRREIMGGTRVFVQFLRGRHILLTSGADSPSQVRGPFDVVNIGKMLKLTAAQALDAISTNAAEMLRHCSARRLKFLPLEVLSGEAYQDRWGESNSVFASTRTVVRAEKKKKRKQAESYQCSDNSDEDPVEEAEEEEDHSAIISVGSLKRARLVSKDSAPPNDPAIPAMLVHASDTDDFIQF